MSKDTKYSTPTNRQPNQKNIRNVPAFSILGCQERAEKTP
jgi:hypothetical protein